MCSAVEPLLTLLFVMFNPMHNFQEHLLVLQTALKKMERFALPGSNWEANTICLEERSACSWTFCNEGSLEKQYRVIAELEVHREKLKRLKVPFRYLDTRVDQLKDMHLEALKDIVKNVLKWH
jgi:hypothetical protein